MTRYSITPEERTYLRELAKKQLEIANLPIMAKRAKQWMDLNSGRHAVPPVVIETWTFDVDFMPYDKVIKCKSKDAVGIEWQLIGNIRNHELLNDDKVISPYFEIGWQTSESWFGFEIERIHAKEEGLAYLFKHPIKDLSRDLDKLKPATITVNKEATFEWKAFVEEVLGDILPVRLIGEPGGFSLTNLINQLMGLEDFWMAMYDDPDNLHKLFRFLTDDYIRLAKFKEENGLLTIRNSNEAIITSHIFTEELPAPGFDGTHVRLKDSWIGAESQETSSISPEMFEEFCLPYYAEACGLMGKVYYGCCEPVNGIYDILLRDIPNIAKLSISKWCNEDIIGEALSKNRKVVYSRKPDPTFVGIGGPVLDDDAWRAHVTTTLKAARGCQLEFVMRDIYSSGGDLNKARRSVEIAREEAERYYN